MILEHDREALVAHTSMASWNLGLARMMLQANSTKWIPLLLIQVERDIVSIQSLIDKANNYINEYNALIEKNREFQTTSIDLGRGNGTTEDIF